MSSSVSPSELARLSATQAAALLASRQLSAEECARACLARVAEREREVGAWAHIDPEQVLAQEIALARGERRERGVECGLDVCGAVALERREGRVGGRRGELPQLIVGGDLALMRAELRERGADRDHAHPDDELAVPAVVRDPRTARVDADEQLLAHGGDHVGREVGVLDQAGDDGADSGLDVRREVRDRSSVAVGSSAGK
jgi:hypothetical protein